MENRPKLHQKGNEQIFQPFFLMGYVRWIDVHLPGFTFLLSKVMEVWLEDDFSEFNSLVIFRFRI